jgi:hypothetical protein
MTILQGAKIQRLTCWRVAVLINVYTNDRGVLSAMSNQAWTLAGLFITTLIAILTISYERYPRSVKAARILLAVVGFLVGWRGAAASDTAERHLKELLHEAYQELSNAHTEIALIRQVTGLINATVGELGVLDRLAGNARYYVRIAAGKCTDPDLLRAHGRLLRHFKGAASSGLVALRPKPNGFCELIFGQRLSPVAAEVFQRLAMSHGMTPSRKDGSRQIAEILQEP